jgi:hypothetical protein
VSLAGDSDIAGCPESVILRTFGCRQIVTIQTGQVKLFCNPMKYRILNGGCGWTRFRPAVTDLHLRSQENGFQDSGVPV